MSAGRSSSGHPSRTRSEAAEKALTRLAVGLVIASPVLAIGAGVLGAAEVYPYDYAMTVALVAGLTPIALALLIGAVGGMYVMGGWKLAPMGVVFVAGFGALALGILTASLWWRDVGVGLLALSGAVFYALGVTSGRIPPSVLARWANPGAILVGAVVAIVGHRLAAWYLLLFGALAVGCGIGGLLGRWWVGRQAPVPEET